MHLCVSTQLILICHGWWKRRRRTGFGLASWCNLKINMSNMTVQLKIMQNQHRYLSFDIESKYAKIRDFQNLLSMVFGHLPFLDPTSVCLQCESRTERMFWIPRVYIYVLYIINSQVTSFNIARKNLMSWWSESLPIPPPKKNASSQCEGSYPP